MIRALAKTVAHNTLEAWAELAMLPKATLCPPPRRGKRHAKASAAYNVDRLTRWLHGEAAALWSDLPVLRPAKSGPDTREARQRRATAFAQEGWDRKACSALVDGAICKPSAKLLAEMKRLHLQDGDAIAIDHPLPP